MRDWHDLIWFKTICYEEKMKQSRINVDRSEHLYPVLLWHESDETNICGEYWWLRMVVRTWSPSNFVWFANWITGLIRNYKQWQKRKQKKNLLHKKQKIVSDIYFFKKSLILVWKHDLFFWVFCVWSRWCNNGPSHRPWSKYSQPPHSQCVLTSSLHAN